MYRYVGNNTVHFRDPTGLGCICDGGGKWHYEPTTHIPDESLYGSNSIGYINDDETAVIDHDCYDCDENGAVVVDFSCIERRRGCQEISRLKNIGALPEDYPERCE